MVCFALCFEIFFEKNYLFFVFVLNQYFLMFLDYFDMLMLKIIFLKKYYFNVF
jgi:hypothetical protein